jgi:hypothetical protein
MGQSKEFEMIRRSSERNSATGFKPAIFLLASRTLMRASNLFLRRQLALYQERKVEPRRIDPATRITLALLSR